MVAPFALLYEMRFCFMNATMNAIDNHVNDTAPKPAHTFDGRQSLVATVASAPVTSTLPHLMTPIRGLGPVHRTQIREHLLSLATRDRYLRFGYAASDSHVIRYVESLDFTRDDVFGIINRQLELVAVAHLAYAGAGAKMNRAEFGVSVLGQYRGQGLGARLYNRAVMHARNAGIGQMYIHALSENTPMLKIARRAGSTIHREGTECEAFLKLPPADFNSRMTEAIEQKYAEFDYQLNVQAHHMQDLLQNLQRWQKNLRTIGAKSRHATAD